jgi:hypothetical protein
MPQLLPFFFVNMLSYSFLLFIVIFYVLSNISSFQVSLLAAVSVIIYSNAETARSTILVDNKGKAGIYLWTHKGSGKKYVAEGVLMI